MVGLVPAIHGSDEPIVEVVPAGIGGKDQPHLPPSRPMLDIVLALDGTPNVAMGFEIDQAFEAVPLCEALHYPFPVLPDATGEVAGYAGVECAVRAVTHHVDPGTHCQIMMALLTQSNRCMDGRDRPGHDEGKERLSCMVLEDSRNKPGHGGGLRTSWACSIKS